MTPPAPLRLALLQYPVERPRDVAAFAAKLDTWLARIAGQADLAVLPEYAAVELGAALSGNAWAGSTGDGLAVDEAGELRAMTDAAPAILAAMQEAARRAGLWLLPGTLPMRGPDGLVRNRAPLIDPEGRLAFQDKRFMTRFEAERWIVSPGAAPQVFDTPWGRIGISICYDVEFPAHVRAQVEASIVASSPKLKPIGLRRCSSSSDQPMIRPGFSRVAGRWRSLVDGVRVIENLLLAARRRRGGPADRP